MSRVCKLIVRSVVIDYLKNRFQKERVAVVYVYFDYKDQQNQKGATIIASLLKQLVCKLQNLPLQLETLYNECVCSHTRPDISILRQLFVESSQELSSVYVVFDALDECGKQQLDDILSFVKLLQESRANVLLTMREHLRYIVKIFKDPVILPISAEEHDVRNYLQIELAKESIVPSIQKKILETLTAHAKGMYCLF
jgi:hypothetical protein